MSTGCLMQGNSNLFVVLSNMFITWQQSWANSNQYILLSQILLTNLIPAIKHLHKAHYHPLSNLKDHPADTLTTTKFGLMSKCSPEVHILKLYWELLHRMDRDHNGLIYGQDFIIDEDDPNKPPNLTAAEQNVSIIIGERLPYGPTKRRISWNTYLDSVSNSSITIAPTLEGKLIQEATLQIKLSKMTGNCQNEIYGLTFIIDPNDPDKPEYLKDLEQSLNRPLPKRTMSWADFQKSCPEYQLRIDEGVQSTTGEDCGYICTRLLGEWLKGYDLDNNGLVYGQDFVLSGLEPKKCRCLKDIEMDVDWAPPQGISIFMWEDFINTFPDKNPDDRGDL